MKENKIVPGPFLDQIISLLTGLPKNFMYSRQMTHAMMIIDQHTGKDAAYLNITLNKQPNFQVFKVQMDDNIGESGYFTMAICMAVLQPYISILKGQDLTFLKEKFEKSEYYKFQIDDSYDYDNFDVELDEFYNKYQDLFKNLHLDQIEALIDYANS